MFIAKTRFGEAMLTKNDCFSYKKNAVLFFVFAGMSLFYFSETQLFPTPAFPADPPDPPDPGKMVPELALRPSLPRAPGVRMT